MTHKAESALKWIIALDAFDYGDRSPLANLIVEEPIPDELRPAIAKVVGGERTPNKRAASKLKLPADERMQIAATVAEVIDLINELKKGNNYVDTNVPGWSDHPPPPESRRKLIDLQSEKFGTEPIIEIRKLEEKSRQVISRPSKSLGVSEETIENIVRDYRKKISNYPNV